MIGNITETVVPYLKEKLNVYRLTYQVAEHEVKEAKKREESPEGSPEGQCRDDEMRRDSPEGEAGWSPEGEVEGSPEGVSEESKENVGSREREVSQAEVECKMERYDVSMRHLYGYSLN